MFEALIGQSPNFEALLRSARMVAATDVTVLIVGETGTGKEAVAHRVATVKSATAPYIAVDCGCLTKELALSELFGHESGAFTGCLKL